MIMSFMKLLLNVSNPKKIHLEHEISNQVLILCLVASHVSHDDVIYVFCVMPTIPTKFESCGTGRTREIMSAPHFVSGL